jgi:hypothetical protein
MAKASGKRALSEVRAARNNDPSRLSLRMGINHMKRM